MRTNRYVAALKLTEGIRPDVAPPSEGDLSIAGVMPALAEKFEAEHLREVYSQHRSEMLNVYLCRSYSLIVLNLVCDKCLFLVHYQL